jgi:hypothetical protein
MYSLVTRKIRYQILREEHSRIGVLVYVAFPSSHNAWAMFFMSWTSLDPFLPSLNLSLNHNNHNHNDDNNHNHNDDDDDELPQTDAQSEVRTIQADYT